MLQKKYLERIHAQFENHLCTGYYILLMLQLLGGDKVLHHKPGDYVEDKK